MGRFLNPDNRAFQIALNSKIYVDKTGLLDITNESIDTDAAFVCNRLDGTYQSYWSQTGTYESILPRINKVLVGISYDKKEKTHQCSIKVYQKCKK